jgi:hypothetical protein
MLIAILTAEKECNKIFCRFSAAYLLTTTTARTVVVNAIAASSKPISLNFMAIEVPPPSNL